MKKLLAKGFSVFSLVALTVAYSGSILAETKLAAIDSIAPDSTQMGALNSYKFTQKFGRGWNLGNTLEAIGGETNWGNPKTTQRLIDSVKAAGFNSIRIPVAWSRFTDKVNYIIDTNWMKRVEQVVNYALKDSMYVIMNEHWDGGWLQPTAAKQEEANKRLAAMWKQIAIRFRDYNNYLVFAGTNEVMVEGQYSEPSKEYYTVQNGFNQLFVSTVRATGGRNAYRYLAVQGFNTNIDYTDKYFVLPKDSVKDRLILEVHYYDPYNFTINGDSKLYVWGKDVPGSEAWANEAHADQQFQLMKSKFVDKNIGVIIGEYAAQARIELGDSLNKVHARYRYYYTKYVTRSMVRHGLIPFYWDSGYNGNNASGLFNRSTGAKAYPEIIEAIIDTNNVKCPYVKPTTSVQTSSEEKFKLYPNPVSSSLKIEFETQTSGSVSLFNIYGQFIKFLNTEKKSAILDVSDLNPGIYVVQLKTQEGNWCQKFLKN